MKAITMITLTAMLMASVMAEDQSAMEAFVGGVYREGGFAVVLDKDTALVNGKLILRDGDVYITPKGAYSNDRGTYSGREGIVVQDGDVFTGRDGTRIGAGALYFGAGEPAVVATGLSTSMRKP